MQARAGDEAAVQRSGTVEGEPIELDVLDSSTTWHNTSLDLPILVSSIGRVYSQFRLKSQLSHCMNNFVHVLVAQDD